jgi:tetratricopeptide (TPR) repeat protein
VKTTKNVKYYLASSAALATFILYLPALRNEFVGVWDDNAYVAENVAIRSVNLTFFRWAFFDFHASNWHPLTWISHAVDYALWGPNPLGHHLTNIILHAANTAIVVLLMLKMLEIVKERTIQNTSTIFLTDRTILIVAGVTGLLFGLHPVHVESVAWVAERKDLLCALFFLLSVTMYTSYVRTGCHEAPQDESFSRFFNKRYLITFGFFILALLSKPMAVTLPVVLLILDWYPFNRIRSLKTLRAASIEKIPFFALSIASSMITILAQRAGESIISLEFAPLSSRVLTASRSLVAYLGKMILPQNLIPLYPYPKYVSLFSLEYLLVIGLTMGITAACVVLVKKQKFWLSAWAYYVVTLIPVLGIVQVGEQSMADRYTYLPSLGPFLVAGLCAAWIVGKVNNVAKSGLLVKFACTAGALIVLFSMSCITVQQIGIWKNGFVLWNHVIAKGFGSATAYNNRGIALDDMGQREGAIADYEMAIALDPRNYFAYNNRGVSYGKDGLYHISIEYFLKSIAINPRHADSYCNLGLSYFYMNQYNSALENYNKAIELKQDFDMAYLNRGNVFFITGNMKLALKDYWKACNLGNRKACDAFYRLSQEFLSS